VADTNTTSRLGRALADELRAAIEAVSGRPLTVADGPAPSGQGWGTPITASGTMTGTVTCWIDDAGVRAVAKQMTGLDEAPDEAVATDMLRELWGQATSAITIAAGFAGLALVVGRPSASGAPEGATALVMADGTARLATLAVAEAITATQAAGPATAQGAPRRATDAVKAGPGALPGNLAALLDIDLPLVVRFARTEMSLRALAQLGPGSMVDMGRSPDAPVQLIVGAQVVAEGEVVVVGGNYGVRITSLVSPADRLKAIEI
jgi:flagellar motor switch protein FliN